MRVLVTNDDGVHAPGILALTRALVKEGFDVIVVAPLADMSGTSAALGPGHDDVSVERLHLPDLHDVDVFGVDGPPGLAVMLGYLGAFGEPPDLVASGVNEGGNTGRSVLFSGTVGAALAAASFGMSGVAVSQPPGDPWHVEVAAGVAAAALTWVAARPRGTVLNVNVPNRPAEELRDVRTGPLAPFGIVRTTLEGRHEGRLRLVLRDTDEELDPGSDTMLLSQGYVTVNALVGPRAVDPGDSVEALRRLALGRR
ncbi:MAG TPA: 5'/3'-nucleotidase SurE [Acidimicrobiales bacterium]|nr:5'/3'-nucleotidase SurE [Acidimicrobiales bacterium]